MSNGVWVSSAWAAIRNSRKPTNWGTTKGRAIDDPAQVEVGLGVHDALQRHGAGHHDDADHGEHEGQLVGDELAGGPQPADQGVLVGRRPAGRQDADDRQRADGEGEEDARVERLADRAGPDGDDDVDEKGADQHDHRSQHEHLAVGPLGSEQLLLHELGTVGHQLQRPVRSRFHRAEPALHEGHDLEQERLDDERGRRGHGDENEDDLDQGGCPIGQVEPEDHRSMSPRMKYRLARMVITSGTKTPRSSHGHDRHVAERRRADLAPEGAEATLGDHVVAHLAERVLGVDPRLARLAP